MNKFLKLLVMAFCVCAISLTANAQYINGSTDEIHYKPLGRIVNSSGVKLTADDLSKLLEPNLYTDYKDAARKYKSGKILTWLGTGCLLYSTISMTIGEIMLNTATTGNFNDWNAESVGAGIGLVWSGAFFIAPGIVTSAIGVPKLIKGKKALIGVTEEYNQSQHKTTTATLSFGATNNGFGVALIF